MADPASLIAISGLSKNFHGLRPLRVSQLRVRAGDRLAISGLDAGAAEAFVHLLTGASLPDAGDVWIEGRNTRDISTDTEWLASLDRFGIVTARAVLLEGLPIASNLALPMTLSIEPLAADVRSRVESLASEVGLPAGRLDDQAATLTPEERVRVHLARALAQQPLALLLEHPTAPLDAAASARLGDQLRQLSDARALGWIAITEDAAFARAAGAPRLTLKPGTGELVGERSWRNLWGR